MATEIETALAELCAKHDLTGIAVGINLKQRETSRFDCTIWYDGFSRRGHNCSSGHGSTVGQAVARALTDTAADRNIALVEPPALTLDEAA